MHTNAEVESAVVSAGNVSPLIPLSYLETPPVRFDFSRNNPDIKNIDMMHAESLEAYIRAELKRANRTWGCGGYGENRYFYESSELFKKGDEYRTVHLGLDIWLPPGTPIYAPLDGAVHSFQNNEHFLDYGPTIILQHRAGTMTFYTLYGHLARTSLDGLSEGTAIASGGQIATIGTDKENGSWAPHLHLQIMTDLLGKKGDYPGTATPSESERFLRTCPDPEILLRKFL